MTDENHEINFISRLEDEHENEHGNNDVHYIDTEPSFMTTPNTKNPGTSTNKKQKNTVEKKEDYNSPGMDNNGVVGGESERNRKRKETSPSKNRQRFKKIKTRKIESSKPGKNNHYDNYLKDHLDIEEITNIKIKEVLNEELYFNETNNNLNLNGKQLREYANFYRRQKEQLLHFKYDLNSQIQALCAFLSIFTSITVYETSRKDVTCREALISSWFCFLISIILWFSIFYDYYIYTEIEGLNRNIRGNLIRTSWDSLIVLIIEFCIFFIHPNPVFHGMIFNEKVIRYQEDVTQNLNSIFTFVCFLRFFYLVKMYLIQSEFFCMRTARIGRLWGLNLQTFYSLKANLQTKPYTTLVLIFVSVLFVGTYCTRIFEVALDEISGQNYDNIWNAIWYMFITMTTVGYGDYYPSTVGGRVFGIINCLFGAFLIPFTVSTFTNLLSFENNEEDICLLIDRIALYEDKTQKCKNLVSSYIKIMNELKKDMKKDESQRMSKEEVNKKKVKLLDYFLSFKENTESIGATFKPISQAGIFLSSISEIEKTLDYFAEKLDELNYKVDVYADKYEELLGIEQEALGTKSHGTKSMMTKREKVETAKKKPIKY